MSEKPEILFATLAAGGSHVSSANAMAQAIQKHFPDQYETPIREIMVGSFSPPVWAVALPMAAPCRSPYAKSRVCLSSFASSRPSRAGESVRSALSSATSLTN